MGVVYPKKVWWICSEGHEWQTTIKYRKNQNDCPFCEKEGVKKLKLFLYMKGQGIA
ncbi:MAG: zinc-ribbon domain-containing protein [Proteobacteria bacterium]|nr:zinc-ribbon domain-containing protein [Pseudomonadota bacterium]